MRDGGGGGVRGKVGWWRGRSKGRGGVRELKLRAHTHIKTHTRVIMCALTTFAKKSCD